LSGGGKDRFKCLTPGKFAENLEKYRRVPTALQGHRIGKGGHKIKIAQAHHVFPDKFSDFFRQKGLNHNVPAFGVWVDQKTHGSLSGAYNRRWANFIAEKGEKASLEEIYQFGRDLMKDPQFKDMLKHDKVKF
jgi:hypothetical protein